MAVAIVQTFADFSGSGTAANTSESKSITVGDRLVVALTTYDSAPATVSNSGTALTWYIVAYRDVGGERRAALYVSAPIESTRSVTVTVTTGTSTGGFPYWDAKAWSVSGVNASGSGCDTDHATSGGGQTSTPLTLPTTAITSTTNNNLLWVVAQDVNVNGGYTSSNGTLAGSTWTTGTVVRRAFTSSGASMDLAVSSPNGAPSWQWAAVEMLSTETGGASHTADASVSTTDTITAAAALTRFGAASVATTASITAAATRSQFGAASVATTDAITAAADLTRFGAASVSETVTITAAATVTSAGSADATLSTTATITAAATLSQFADASVAETLSITASASVATTHTASATLGITATLSATATIPGQTPTTVGYMRGVEVVGPTIRPATGAASVPHIVALIGFDATTMRAHLSTSVTPSQYGLPLFAGGAVDPVAAGLIPSGTEYFWFNEAGELYHETGD